ncbi:RHS repeat domain-containing protein [Brevundimonas sp. NPDC090276]|uniref:RHS repeat domain-containing protein n=1 Tax=Brevundimonas sp. NPDC090276 TaxID=3363956 RepID=UPI00383B05B4
MGRQCVIFGVGGGGACFLRGSVAGLALFVVSGGASASPQSHTVTYGYDALGRLASVSHSEGARVS